MSNTLTNSQGHPISDNQNSVTAGENGPVLLMDFNFIDKIAKFDRERIPERVVHAKGAGAHGYFEVTNDITKYCKANLFSEIGKKTQILLRFSTVGGEKGSADTERDPRGFAIKFYTEEGNWDMVGNNTPVFFIRDPIKFPDFIHTQKRNPQTNLKDANMMWDFLSLTPESAHQVTILFSNRGTPYCYRTMNGYGSHTFRWVNKDGETFLVKYHFKTNQGIKNFKADTADKMRGEDPDFATRDLFNAIKENNFPTWDFYVQVMPESYAEKYRINVNDITKVWPHKDFPLIKVGKITLNKNPENYFAEIEQVAFSPSHMVPGIEPSNDKMLQGRLFSYPDTHRHRLGGNYDQIPVNAPKNKVTNGQRDGVMVVNNNGGSDPNYEPNSFKKFTFDDKKHGLSKIPVTGHAGRFTPSHPNSDFEQPGELFSKVMNEEERTDLINNIVSSLKNAQRFIQERQVSIFYKCHPEYGRRVAQGLGIPLNKPSL